MTTYFGFAISDSMFPGECLIARRELTVDEVKEILKRGVESCINPGHKATIHEMHRRFGIDLPIPTSVPKVSLASGDNLVVASMRGLPRLVGRREYTEQEIADAAFSFALYTVSEPE